MKWLTSSESAFNNIQAQQQQQQRLHHPWIRPQGAVVTGANRGIGLEMVRQLAAARNEKRGLEATNLLGLSNVLLFHRLDVQDARSIRSLAEFIQLRFQRLDILNGLRAKNIDTELWLAGKVVNMIQDVVKTTYDKAKECIEINYYGVKNLTETLLPLLQLSSGARIVNRVPDEKRRKELGDIETLTEERIDLHDVQENKIEANGWQKMLPAYSISKLC
ncbi:hypothetical protein OROMI_014032 [Orobanche minor]